MTIYKTIINLGNKDLHYESSVSFQQKLTSVEQIIIETEWTDAIQRLVDFVNKSYLKNFTLRLELEHEN
jgi:hypothetical protein